MRFLLYVALFIAVVMAIGFTIDRMLARRDRRPRELEAVRRDRLVEEIRERAWRDRDVSPTLAGALIERIRVSTSSTDERDEGGDASLIEDLRELAWQHRDSDPELSVIVRDMISKA